MSRCGSTLVSQMLAAAQSNRILSEPTALNALFSGFLLRPEFPRKKMAGWLRTLVSAMGCALAGESRYFLKLECWHTLALPLLMEAFPQTPWIFLHREPAEVLVSQVRLPGSWTVPDALDPRVFELTEGEVPGMPKAEYHARLLATIGKAALRYRDLGFGKLVNYRELPEWSWMGLPEHFGLTFDPTEVEQMRRAAQRNAKTPQLTFADDRQQKRHEVTAEIQSAVDRWLTPVFGKL